METLSETTRARLHMQGFDYVDDETLAEVGPWYRLATGMCATWVTIATAFASYMAIWALVPFAILGAVLPRHPFDLIYHIGIRRITKGRPLPKHRLPRRFACSVATVWLLITGYSFYAGNATLGYVLGFIMLALAMVPTLTDFCVPSFVFHKISTLFGKGQRETGYSPQETISQ